LPLLHRVVADVPEEFARAVERAMAKDRADRPATAGVFASEIRSALGLASGIHPTTDAYRHHDAAAAAPPDFESSQTLVREEVASAAAVNTAIPRAIIETAPQAPPAPRAATAAEEQTGGRTPETTPEQTPFATQAHGVAQQPARRSPFKLIVAGALALLLVCVTGAGGWLAWNSWQARRAAGDVERGLGTTGGAAVETPAHFELMNYWIEAFDDDAGEGAGRRIAAREISLPSGQQFKFHFVARERGYLYIVGPGVGNAPTTFLTARPAGVMKTNLASAGADFTFPYGDGQVLELDKNPATEEYVVIFSRTPLLSPAFLATDAGHVLTPAELKELEDLRARSKTALPVADVKDSGAQKSGAVAVAVQSAGAPSEPVIFDIRIEHR
jgi:hypothetical protein